MKPNVQHQGVIVVEPDGAGGLLAMFPDGDIEGFRSATSVAAACSRWFAAHVADGSIGVGRIQWRNCAPPKKRA